MRNPERQLLLCLSAYRHGNMQAERVETLTPDDWRRLMKLSADHKLRAVVYDTLWSTPGFCGGDQKLAAAWKRETILQAITQAARTEQLLQLTQAMEDAHIRYAVVKGAVCRAMYTKPDLRPSGDEDILIAEEDLSICSHLFTENGMVRMAEADDSVTHWFDRQSGLHVELHTELFSSHRTTDMLLNSCFTKQLSRTVFSTVSVASLRTLDPTYHFLFLVCHAMKHFISGGFGIRTLCDIVTFAETYGAEIDQQTVYVWLEKVCGRVFLDQLLDIGRSWLEFDLDSSPWELSKPANSEEMLEDILDAGVYGQSTMSRRHSGALVLRAAEEGQTRPSVIRAAFPPKEQLVGRYPILEKQPVLLPVMWVHRLGAYGLELIKSSKKDNSLRESVTLGKRRTEMMIRYGIIPGDKTKD